jgi:Ca2+-transporting ATPase
VARVAPSERLLASGPERGLEPAEVSSQRARWGSNEIVEAPGRSWRDVARDTASDPMIWFLLATGVVYAALGEVAEALTLFGAIAPLVGMDAYLHHRTRASVAALSATLSASARVVRGGQRLDVPVRDLVPGDLVLLQAGESVPADGVVVAVESLHVDESTLTGESAPAPKVPVSTPPRPDAVLGDEHWALAGTRVLAGHARMRVVFTGQETLYGQIVQQVVHGSRAPTPLQTAVRHLVSVLLVVATALCVVLALVRLRQGAGLLDALVSAATLAVAALPEEFPVAVAVFLAVGVHRLARRRALVRRSVTVETIGRVTTICSDKTGTITQGRLRVAHLLPAAETAPARLLELARLAARAEGNDPLDAAILDAATSAGVVSAPRETLATFPFTEDRRRETSVTRGAGGVLATAKGAPEVVLALCALSVSERAAWTARVAELAAGAHKVIACAARPLDGWPGGEPDRDFRFAGLVALEDLVREGVAESVRRCQEAGIHVLMVTGDHANTALAVAREIGLGEGRAPTVLTGDELEQRLERADARLREVDVVARARPLQKLAIVRSLQAAGEHVAVTGDGVNDVPALQAADVGVAMGLRGTRSAREVASIVLLDDDFRSIVRAIAEGRQLFRNLQLSFIYLLTIHIPLVLTATVVPLAGFPLLYLPIHVVWLETLIHPTALLVFQELPSTERLEPRRVGRRPRFFSPREWTWIGVMGVLATAVVLALYHRSLGPRHADLGHARAMALTSMCVTSAALTVVLSGLRTRSAWLVSLVTLAGTGLLVQTPGLSTVLHVTPLHADDWALTVAGSALAVGAPLLLGRRLLARS